MFTSYANAAQVTLSWEDLDNDPAEVVSFAPPEVDGFHSDHMALQPNGARMVVSDTTAQKAHVLNTADGARIGSYSKEPERLGKYPRCPS